MKKRILSLLLAGCMALILTACGGGQENSQPEKPTIPQGAIDLPEYGIAAVLPEEIQTHFETLVFADSYGGYQQNGISVTGSMVFLFQSQEVYDRVLELQNSGEELGYEEYQELTVQTREFAMVASLPTDGVTVYRANAGDMYKVTGYLHNDLLEEKDGYSYYFCYDDLDISGLSEASAEIYTSLYNALPALQEGLILYQPVIDEEKPFATVDTTDLAGNPFLGAEFGEHTLTIVNIWATYCTPCIEEMPDLERIYQDYKDKGVTVLGLCSDISAGGDFTKANEIVELTGVTYPTLVPDNVLLRYLTSNIQAVPTTLFIDSTGAIVGAEVVGQRSYDKFVTELENRLALIQDAE